MLRGIITSSSQIEELSYVVEIYDSSFNLITETFLEEKNYFEINIDSTNSSIIVLITTLGCDVYTQKVNLSNSKTVFLYIELQNCIQKLDKILVTASKSFIKEHGDTLIFDVEGFKTKTDLTLGDILKRIPGVEISETNQILYQGKRIQQVLVHGRDILNNQHNLALKGLKAEDIDNIQIVHDYKPFHKRFSQDYTSGVSMNIGLNKSAEKKINGAAEVLIGNKERHKVDIDAIKVKSHVGSATFLRSNNCGIAVINTLEYLGLMTKLDGFDKNKSGDLEIVPDILLPSANAFDEKQHLISSSSDFNTGAKSKVKISLIGMYKTLAKKADVQKLYYDSNSSFNGVSEEDGGLSFVSSKMNFKNQLSNDFLLEIDIPFLYKNQKMFNKQGGFYENFPYLSLFNEEDKFLTLSPKLALNMRHKKDWSSSHKIGFGFQNQTFERVFSEGSNNVPLYNQGVNNQRSNFSVESSLENRYKFFLFKLSNYIDFGFFNTYFKTNNLLQLNNPKLNNYQWKQWKPSIQYGVRNEHWMSHIRLELSREFMNTNTEIYRRTWLNPLFRFKYTWNIAKFIGLTILQTKHFIDQRNAFGVFLLEDNLQIGHFSLEPGLSSQTNQLDFYFFDLQKNKKITMNCNFNISETTNAISRMNSFLDSFVISEVYLAKKLQTSNLGLSFSYPFFKNHYNFKIKLNARQNKSNRISNNSIIGQQLKLTTALSSKLNGNFNARLNGKFSVLKQVIGNQVHTWNLWEISTNFKYNYKTWKLNLDWGLEVNNIGNSTFEIYKLSFGVNYVLNKRWSLNIVGYDILNLNQSESSQLISTLTYIEQSSFYRQKGSLLIGGKYLF